MTKRERLVMVQEGACSLRKGPQPLQALNTDLVQRRRDTKKTLCDFAAPRETYQVSPGHPVKKTRCALRQDRVHGSVFFYAG